MLAAICEYLIWILIGKFERIGVGLIKDVWLPRPEN